MRALLCTTSLAVILGSCLAPVARGEDSINWQSSVPAAQRLAAETNRLVLVHFWSPSCGPCMRMDAEVFPVADVGRTLQTLYVPVKLNADYSPTTAREYGITSLPMDVVISPSGQVIDKFNSPINATQYIEQLRRVAVAAKTSSQVATAPGTPASSSPWAQPAVTQTAGTSPAASSTMAPTTSSNPVFGGPAAAPRTDVKPVANTSPYASDRYADYLRQHPAQSQAAPATGALPWPPQNTTGQQPAGAASAANPWQQGAPVATQQQVAAPSMPAKQPVATVAPAAPAAVQQPVSAPVQQAQASVQLPPGNPPLGLDGYCPVRLREEYRWVLGDRKWGAVHRGRTYLFAGQAEQQKFMANPDSFSPVIAGNDPVLAFDHGQAVPGQRKLGVYYGEGQAARVYLFSSDDTLKRFCDNPERFATEIRQAEAPSRGPIR